MPDKLNDGRLQITHAQIRSLERRERRVHRRSKAVERVGTPGGVWVQPGVAGPQNLADHGAFNSQAKRWQGGSGIECEILGGEQRCRVEDA